MTTGQLLIVCGAALVALGGVGFVILYALDTRERLAEKQLEQARLADHLGCSLAGDLASAVAALEALGSDMQAALERSEPGPRLAGLSVVVHTRKPDDQSVRGVVAAHYADRLVLRDAQYLHATGAQAAGGLVEVLLINVSTIQQLEAPEAA